MNSLHQAVSFVLDFEGLNMNMHDRVTRKADLLNNIGFSVWDVHGAQQSENAYQAFYDFISEVKPSRILEIGTAQGGFTMFLRTITTELGLSATEIRSYDIYSQSWFPDMILAGIDIRIENIFDDTFAPNAEVVDFINRDGITVVLCDGGFKIKEFNSFAKHIKRGDFILAHDYAETKEIFDSTIMGKVWNWCEIVEADIIEASIANGLTSYRSAEFANAVWVCKEKTK